MFPTDEGLGRAQTATHALFGDHQSLHSLSSELYAPSSELSRISLSLSLSLCLSLSLVCVAGEQLLDLFSNVPTSELTFDLLRDELTVGDVARLAAVASSQCNRPTTHSLWL